jgi:hypothetical protein
MSLFPEPLNLHNITNLVNYTNEATDTGYGPVLGILLLLGLPFLSFLLMKAAFTFERAGVAAGFFGFVLSIILISVGMIDMTIFVVANLFFVIFVYLVVKERGGEET